jgi:ankyrin repeat protein
MNRPSDPRHSLSNDYVFDDSSFDYARAEARDPATPKLDFGTALEAVGDASTLSNQKEDHAHDHDHDRVSSPTSFSSPTTATSSAWLSPRLPIKVEPSASYSRDRDQPESLPYAVTGRSRYRPELASSSSSPRDGDRIRRLRELHHLVEDGDSVRLEKLLLGVDALNYRAVIDDIVLETGLTVTHMASDRGDCQTLRVLMYLGFVDVNRPEANGLRPLHFAAWKNHTEAMLTLGESPRLITSDLNKVCGMALIHMLTKVKYCVPSLRALFSLGVHVETRDLYGMTALHHAVMAGNLEAAQFLLERRANADLRDDRGESALSAALDLNDGEMIRLLARYGFTSSPSSRNDGAFRPEKGTARIHSYSGKRFG